MRLAGAVVVLVLALAGCTPAAPSAKPTPSASATPSSAPAPEPTKPALAELVLTHEGFGPLVVGSAMTDTHPETDVVVHVKKDCGDGTIDDHWEANYPDRPLGNAVVAFVAGTTESLTFVAVYSPDPGTAEGIRVGSVLPDLLASYPTAAVVSTGSGRDRYSVAGSPASLYFEVNSNAEGFGWTDEEVDRVAVMGLSTGDLASPPSFHVPAGCL